MIKSRILGGVAAAFTALAAVAPNASAAAEPSSDEIAAAVYASSDVPTAFAALTPDQQATFAARMSNWVAEEVETRTSQVQPDAAELKAMGGSKVAGGCWYQYRYHKWKDLGINTGDTWMTARWCSSGGRMTSYKLTDQGGQGKKGIKYEGLGGAYYLNVNWEVRMAQSFKFSVVWANANPCMQIRGGGTGLYSYRADCNLS